MAPFVGALETYHSLTAPSTWLEGVVKAYVGDGMAADFYREVAKFVDDDSAELIRDVLVDEQRAAFAVREVEAAIAAQPAIAGRLALWARRLVGEAISQTQHVLAERDALMLLLVEGTGDLDRRRGPDRAAITDRHAERMSALGLRPLTGPKWTPASAGDEAHRARRPARSRRRRPGWRERSPCGPARRSAPAARPRS